MAATVYQFKIVLKDISPTIWRRILVPDTYTFWDLHVAIQDAMGWQDYHLHVFRIRRKNTHSITEIGIPNEDRFEDEPEIIVGWDVPISNYFFDIGTTFEYEYDFGDSWEHEIIHEGILIKEKGVKYPLCIGGARACPPEDCGGVPGYYRMLEIISNPNDGEYENMMTWLGNDYDPEQFTPSEAKFDNPKKRWNQAFSEY